MKNHERSCEHLIGNAIIDGLLRMGRKVTRANWLLLDRGSADPESVDPETAAYLRRIIPNDID